MGAVRVLVTFNSSPTAIVPEESAPRFHPKNTSCFQDPIADQPRAFPDLQAAQIHSKPPTMQPQCMPSLHVDCRPCRGLSSSPWWAGWADYLTGLMQESHTPESPAPLTAPQYQIMLLSVS